jgi:DNA gyrase subunit B
MVGLTAVNALSELFTITSIRYGEKAIMQWRNGIVDIPLTIKKMENTNKHGLIVTFKPDQKILGECQINIEELQEWIEKTSYLTAENITISFNVSKRKGKESSIQKKYKNKNGLVDYLKKISKNYITEPIRIYKHIKLKEMLNGEEKERVICLEVVFSYTSDASEEKSDAFCNFVNTIDKGTHYDAVKQAIMQFLTKSTKDALSDREAKKLDIIFNDCNNGLVLLINLMTTFRPNFTSQTKHKLSNNELFRPIKQMMYEGLYEYFNKEPKDLKRVCDHVKTNAKVRVKSQEVRNAVIKGESNNLDENRIKNFTPANGGKNSYKELFIIEGDSAAGSCRDCRDTYSQALFSVRGVPLNTFGLELPKVLLNDEFKDLVKILGCNIGDRFDLNKLKYDKIIIMSDGDIDGFRILSLVAAFFLYHIPDIVQAGRLYKAVTPLYALNDKRNPFVLSKKDYVKVFESKIEKNINIFNVKTNVIMKSKELEDFLFKNRTYLEELRRTANRFAIHPYIIEFILFYRKSESFNNKLKMKFPEMNILDNIITGVYEGRFQNVIIDDIFDKRVKDMENLIFKINNGKIFYKIQEASGNTYEDRGIMTIGELMNLCQKFVPSIKTRFKGLGELNSEDLWSTTMNPVTRQLVRLTVQDIKEDLDKFKVLHGTDIVKRKEIMEFFKLDREEIDN